ncbi:hypothetical protein IHE45_03G026700 [Dioscorea alata]|uniref:Uncharacterized protein n=1 Tax=Dioscorea alata TaxID=55571 RepID=A0ACB7WJD4_DIOAL|nr:hypothetical protein IHE45_03G026700 [Dioscorea alata]
MIAYFSVGKLCSHSVTSRIYLRNMKNLKLEWDGGRGNTEGWLPSAAIIIFLKAG